ncbi:MAG TPA: hypothetical protein VGE14_02335 [Marmoricola sp.]
MTHPGSGSASGSRRESDWERRKRLAEVFGDTLPDTTSDERDDASPEKDSATDRWLREQVPPHHGGA